jgi:hypothetical protein
MQSFGERSKPTHLKLLHNVPRAKCKHREREKIKMNFQFLHISKSWSLMKTEQYTLKVSALRQPEIEYKSLFCPNPLLHSLHPLIAMPSAPCKSFFTAIKLSFSPVLPAIPQCVDTFCNLLFYSVDAEEKKNFPGNFSGMEKSKVTSK